MLFSNCERAASGHPDGGAAGANRDLLRGLTSKRWIIREDVTATRDARRTLKIARLLSPSEQRPSAPKLNANQQGLQAGQAEEHEACQDVQNPDVFVVDGGDPSQQPNRPQRLDRWRGIRRNDGGHLRLSR